MQSKDQLRAIAASLAQERFARTPQQQLILLNNRLGKDRGAKKERTKLLSLIHVEIDKEQPIEAKPAKPVKKKHRVDIKSKTDTINS